MIWNLIFQKINTHTFIENKITYPNEKRTPYPIKFGSIFSSLKKIIPFGFSASPNNKSDVKVPKPRYLKSELDIIHEKYTSSVTK